MDKPLDKDKAMLSVSNILDKMVAPSTPSTVLGSEANKSNVSPSMTRDEVRNCIETLIVVLRNVIQNPDKAEPYRTIRLSNAKFNQNVWRYTQARQLLLALGWIVVENVPEKGDCIQLPMTTQMDLITAAVAQLADKRILKPDQNADIKVYTNLIDPKVREEEEKQKYAQERKEALARVKKEKEERARIAELTKREVAQDRAYRNIRIPLRDDSYKPHADPDRRANPNPRFPGQSQVPPGEGGLEDGPADGADQTDSSDEE